MNIPYVNKNTIFSALLLVIVAVILNKVIPPYVENVFTLVVSKNRTSIQDIHQVRDIETSKTFHIDRIALAEKSRFRHKKLGDLGFGNDYFADIEAPFTVKIAGDYVFYIGSDDGFAFEVDGRQVCEWTHAKDQHDRPFATDSCHIRLKEGEHRFKLSYYQGFGNSGLEMNYSNTTSGTQYLAGQDSKFISF